MDAEQFPGLSVSEFDQLSRHIHLRRCASGTILLAEQEPANIVGGVLAGKLRLQRATGDGRIHLLGFRKSKDTFGQLFAPVSSCSIEAAKETLAWIVDRKTFESLSQRHEGLGRMFLHDALNELDEVRERLGLMGGASVNVRLTQYFLRYVPAGHSSDQVLIRIPVGRRDLADLLGTTVETISRFGRWLSDQGAAHFVSGDTIEVLDWRLFTQLASETEVDRQTRPAIRPAISPREKIAVRSLRLSLAPSGRIPESAPEKPRSRVIEERAP